MRPTELIAEEDCKELVRERRVGVRIMRNPGMPNPRLPKGGDGISRLAHVMAESRSLVLRGTSTEVEGGGV